MPTLVCLASNDDDFEDDQIVVGLAPGASIAAVNARYGTHTIDHTAGTADYLLGTGEGADLDALTEAMSLDADVAFAEKNATSEVAEGIQGTIASVDHTATHSTFRNQPALLAVRGMAAQTLARGAHVLVAVVDSGLDPNHEELAGRLSPAGYDFVDGDRSPWETANGIDDDGDGTVDEGYGHGTHVSGLVLLAAPEAVILPVRVLDDDGRGPAYRVAGGIRYAIDKGASVINLSLSIRHHSSLVSEAIQEALERGVTIVVGVGNHNSAVLDYPASEPGVIAMAATDENGVKLPISNYGAAVTVSAPGSNLLSAYGGHDYAHWGGTSMATPFGSGGAALLLGRYPTLGHSDITRKIVETATSIEERNTAYTGLLGAGLVNLEGLATVAAPNADSVKVREAGGAVVSWEPVEGATAYDLIRGLVSNLRTNDEGETLGPVTCLANDTTATSTLTAPDSAQPAAGQVFFYLMRPVGGSVPPDYGSASEEGQLVPGSGDCPY